MKEVLKIVKKSLSCKNQKGGKNNEEGRKIIERLY